MGLAKSYCASDESEMIDELLYHLLIDKSHVNYYKRLTKKGISSFYTSTPSLMLIQFKDKETQKEALRKSYRLKTVEKFKNVFINQDRTNSQRRNDMKLREERRRRNAELPITLSEGKNCISSKDGKKYFWGIRNDQIKLIEIDNNKY